MTASADFGAAAVSSLVRVAALVLLAIGAGLALVFAFAAAMVVAIMVLGAALAMRLVPRPVARDGVLDARRTPSGWVVEASAKRQN